MNLSTALGELYVLKGPSNSEVSLCDIRSIQASRPSWIESCPYTHCYKTTLHPNAPKQIAVLPKQETRLIRVKIGRMQSTHCSSSIQRLGGSRAKDLPSAVEFSANFSYGRERKERKSIDLVRCQWLKDP